MGKHSRSANTREWFTSGERAKIAGKYGTMRARLGADSQRQFDQCGLCLQRLSDAVATPAGNLYCRACIVEYLLEAKRALTAQRAAWEAEAAKRAREVTAAETAAREAEVVAFMAREESVMVRESAASAGRAAATGASSSGGSSVGGRGAGASAADAVSVDAAERARR